MFTVDRKVTTDRQINSFKILLNEPGYLLEFIKGIWLRFCFVFFRKQVWLEVICKSRKKIHQQTNQQTKTKANWSMDKTQENCISPVRQAGHSFNHILLSKCYCLCDLGGGSCGSCMFQESCEICKCYFLSLKKFSSRRDCLILSEYVYKNNITPRMRALIHSWRQSIYEETSAEILLIILLPLGTLEVGNHWIFL